MSAASVTAHFERVADLLDRACVAAPDAPSDVDCLLIEAEQAIAEAQDACNLAGNTPSAAPMWRAVERVRHSHSMLVRVIEEEATRLEGQLAALSQERQVLMSYLGTDAATASRFDRVG